MRLHLDFLLITTRQDYIIFDPLRKHYHNPRHTQESFHPKSYPVIMKSNRNGKKKAIQGQIRGRGALAVELPQSAPAVTDTDDDIACARAESRSEDANEASKCQKKKPVTLSGRKKSSRTRRTK